MNKDAPETNKPLHTEKHFPLFSVITVTRENYRGLKNTCESLDLQGFEDFEWLVVDGASTDETVEFLRARRRDARTDTIPFRFVSAKDDGIYDAMNIGIEMARGHYLLFLNAGDTLAQAETLRKLGSICKKNPDFVYGDALEVSEEMLKKGRKPVSKLARSHEDVHFGMFTHHQAMLYRRHIVRDMHLRYSLRYRIASDYDFTVRFLQNCKDIQYVKEALCIFELGGVSQQNAWLGRKEQYMIRDALELVPLPLNLWILCAQSFLWTLRRFCPWGYAFVRAFR